MSYRFLIVHHSATLRTLTKRTLRLVGLSARTVYEAASGREALELLAAHRVDLVLADLNPEEADGAEMIGRILSEPDTRSVPVVILSANPDPRQLQEIQRLLRAGAKGHLRRPFTPAALREMVTRVLEPTYV